MKLNCLTLIFFGLGFSALQAQTVTPAPVNQTTIPAVTATADPDGPVFYLYDKVVPKPDFTPQPPPNDPGSLIDDLRRRALNGKKDNAADVDIPADLAPSSYIPVIGQEVYRLSANFGHVLSTGPHSYQVNHYVASQDASGPMLCFGTERDQSDHYDQTPHLYFTIGHYDNKDQVHPYEKTVTFEKMNDLLHMAANKFVDSEKPLREKEQWEDFSKNYTVEASFAVSEMELQVLEILKPGKHRICFLQFGKDLIIKDHAALQAVFSINTKTYFWFKMSDWYTATEEVDVLNEDELKEICSTTISTD